MIRKIIRKSVIALLIVMLVIPPPAARACAIGPPEAVFIFSNHPDLPLSRFAAGRLGILQPSYERMYLAVAFRYLSGGRFSPGEQAEINALWEYSRQAPWKQEEAGEDPARQWLEARSKVTGTSAPASIASYATPWYAFSGYRNCLPDAFLTAKETLLARSTEFGAASEVVRNWIEAQDKVFAACGRSSEDPGPPAHLQPLGAAFPAVARADREYQIAAAHFYSGEHDTAAQEFQAISQNRASPWRNIAPLLVARSWIRRGTRADSASAEYKAMLTRAEERLRSIAADTTLAEFHSAAQRLLGYVRFRLVPEQRLLELGEELEKGSDASTLKQDIRDYCLLLDNFIGQGEPALGDTTPANRHEREVRLNLVKAKSELTDWILTFESDTPDARNHAIERWKTTGTLPWLVAAVSLTQPGHDSQASLLATADRVKPHSAAFATLRFHRLRLLVGSGKENEARAELDGFLRKNRKGLPPSSLNLFLALRMKLAHNLDEFLAFAPRVAGAVSYWDTSELSMEQPRPFAEESEYERHLRKEVYGRPLFDTDAAITLSKYLPSSLLARASTESVLPSGLRRRVAEATWVRAVLLEDEATAKRAANALQALATNWKAELDEYQNAPAADARRFAATLVLLRKPGLRPFVEPNIGRTTPIQRINNLRDNWWCKLSPVRGVSYSWGDRAPSEVRETLSVLYPAGTLGAPEFLSDSDRKAAAKEWDRLQQIAIAPNWLAEQTLAWAKKHPDDLRVPEALHLVVRASRYGCTDNDTGQYSKAAFDLLQHRYRSSEWAKKTPYWFK